MRRIVVVIAAATACSAIAACGGSTTPPAAVTPSDAGSAITKAQASAYARAINLQAGDLPGMSMTSPEGEKPDATRVGEVERCAGNLTASRVVVNIHSATFSASNEPEHEEIRSDVEVMPSVALAKQNNASNRSQRALACAKHLFPLQLASKDGSRVHYGPVTVSRLPYPLPGVPGSFGYRIAVAILGVPSTVEPIQPHLYVDAFGFLAGPAEVALLATAFPRPVPQEVDERLLSLLQSRATAHKL